MNFSSILIILILLASVFINTNIALAQNETGLTYNSSNHANPSLISPLKQFESGIKSENVKCVTNFQLLIKGNSGQPVCVKTSTISRLVTQGWILPHTIKVENSDYSIKYGINTGTLLAAVYDTTTNSVSLSVNTTNGGYLNVQLPRSFIDSKDKSGVDNIWSVIMDGKDIDYAEKKTDDSRILSFSFDDNPQKIDCSSHCWAGGVFSSTGPYKQETGNTNIPSSSPSISPTSFSYWSGLTDNSLLVQSGWWYQSALSSGSPYMFAEIYGNFVYNLVNCSTSFCGSAMVESANDAIYTTNYADVGNSQWVAYVQDNTSFDYTMFTVPFSTSGASNSLADAVYSLEGQSTPSTSYFPPSPINFTSITLYAPGSGQVNANTNSMSSYDDPLSSTGIPIDVQATGTTTAEIGISW